MTINHGAGNLAKVLSVFEANPDYCHFTVSKSGVSNYKVRFLDQEAKVAAEMSVKLVYHVQPIDVSYARYPDAAQVGLRNTFMLTNADEPEIDKYWARRKKPKSASKGKRTKLGMLTREVITQQVKAGKALLATLQGGAND